MSTSQLLCQIINYYFSTTVSTSQLLCQLLNYCVNFSTIVSTSQLLVKLVYGGSIIYVSYLYILTFYLPDLPCILSGETVGMIDPHKVYFKEGMKTKSTYGWNLKNDQKEMKRINDQWKPLQHDVSYDYNTAEHT